MELPLPEAPPLPEVPVAGVGVLVSELEAPLGVPAELSEPVPVAFLPPEDPVPAVAPRPVTLERVKVIECIEDKGDMNECGEHDIKFLKS